MKKNLVTLLLLVLPLMVLTAQDAYQIVETSRNRIQADTVSTRSRMIITARDGSTTERLVDQYSSDSPDGTKTIIVFQKPASVAGTRFLTIENSGREDDHWIFLPALGRIRRIAASEGSGSFMGTDFSYDDISSTERDVDEDTHSLLGEETLDGEACWKIESVPKDSSYQYSKMISWIQKDNYISRKIELYDQDGELVKILEQSAFADIQGRITPRQTRMTSVNEGTNTVIQVEIMKYDDPIPSGVFTTRFLETGRP